MKQLLGILGFTVLFGVACEETTDECATCYSVKENISTGAIEDRQSEGTECGTAIDSLESIPAEELDEYKYYYSCE